MNDLALREIGTLTGALSRITNGRDAYDLALRLGLLSPGHAHAEDRRTFLSGKRFSELTADELSDEHSYWRSEAGRLSEVLGLLNGQRQFEKLNVKQARAAARSRVRQKFRNEQVKVTQSEVDDEATTDQAYADAEERLTYVEILYVQVDAAREATLNYLEGISREITSRGDQMKARLY